MHSIVIAALVLSLAAPADPPRPIHIVYVEPPGAVWTAEERAVARAGVQASLDFWQELAPAPIALAITSERTITTTGDIYAQLSWSRPYWQPPGLTLFVIDGDQWLLGTSLAQSQTPLGLIWALRSSGDDFAATIAHELGHVAYGLPHQYQDGGDIMGMTPTAAYQARTIGCASLAQLGRPCAAVWLPLIVSPQPGAQASFRASGSAPRARA
jgi:hypothetical protein